MSEENKEFMYELLASSIYFGFPERSEVIEFLEKGYLAQCPQLEVRSLKKRDLTDSIERFFSDNGLAFPDHKRAGFCLAKYYARKIILREIAPYKGAKWIWHRIANEYEHTGEFDQLLVFVGLASEFEDFDDEGNKKFYGEEGARQKQREIEDSIFTEASMLLSI
jgi:hypothetical protein